MTQEDAEFLIRRPEFRRFLFAAIQSAGLLSHEGAAHGPNGRDLSYAEGRRSLGFEILHLAHAGQPEAIRAADLHALTTLDAVIREAMNPEQKEKTHGRRSDDTARYDSLPE